MSDPLAGYKPDWRKQLRQSGGITPAQSSDPLAGYDPEWRKKLKPSDQIDQRLLTATGRRQVEAEDLSAQTETYKALLEREDVTPEQKARLLKAIEQNEQGSWTRRDTEERNPAENLARGVVAGIPKASAGLLDLAGAAANVGWKGSGDKARELARESQAATDEALDPQGKAGLAGDVVGQLAGGMAGYGMLTSATARGLLAVLPQASKAAQLIRVAQTGNVVQRVGGQTLIGVPLDAFQAATMEDATVQDKIKQFALSTGANALFSAVTPAQKIVERSKPGVKPADVQPEKAASLPGERLETTQAEIEGALKKALAFEENKKLDKAAASAWSAANPSKRWKDLKADEKKAIYADYRTKIPAEVAPVEPPVEVPPVAATPVEAPPVTSEVPPVSTPPVDPVQAQLDELKAKMASGYTGMEDKVSSPVETTPIAVERVQTLSSIVNSGNYMDRELFAIQKDLDLLNHPQAELYFEGDMEELTQARSILEQKIQRLSTPGNVESQIIKLRDDVRVRGVDTPELADRYMFFANRFPGIMAGSDNYLKRALQEISAAVRSSAPEPVVAAKAVVPDVVAPDPILDKSPNTLPSARHISFEEGLSMSGDDWRLYADQITAEEKSLESTIFGDRYDEWLAAQRKLESPYYAASSPEVAKALAVVKDIESRLTPEQEKLLYGIEETPYTTAEEARRIASAAVDAGQDLTTDGLLEMVGRLITTGKPLDDLADAIELRGYMNTLGTKGIDGFSAVQRAMDRLVATGYGKPHDIAELTARFFTEAQSRGFFSAVDEPAKIPQLLAPEPELPAPDAPSVFKVGKQVKAEFDVPEKAPSGQVIIEPKKYKLTVTMPDGTAREVQVFNYGWNHHNAKDKLYNWRFTGETEWRQGGSNFKEVESSIKRHMSEQGLIPADPVPTIAPGTPMSIDDMNVQQLTEHIDQLNDAIDAVPETASNRQVMELQRMVNEAAKRKAQLMKEAGAGRPIAEVVGEQAVTHANVLSKQLADLRNKLAVTADEGQAELINQEITRLSEERIAVLRGAKDSGAKINDGQTATVAAATVKPPEIDVTTIDSQTRAAWWTKPVDEMNAAMLQAHAQDIVTKINSMPRAQAEPYIQRFMQAKERYVKLTKPTRNNGFMTVSFPPEIGGGVLGFFTGSMVGDTDEERNRNAFYGLMLGIGAGHGVRRIHMRYDTKKSPLFPGEDKIKDWVKTAAEQEGSTKFVPFLSRLESWYQKIVRPSWAIEKLTAEAGGSKLTAATNPGKLAAMYGRWVAQSEDFIFGRPSMEDADGNSVILKDVNSVVEIANMVDGDTETLGNLMAAMTTIEQATLGKSNSPIPLADAAKFASSVPQKYHDAAKAARKLNLAMVDVMVTAGIIDPASRMQMAQEQWYAPMERIFGQAPKPVNAPAPIGTQGNNLGAMNPVKGRAQGKSPHLIANPFETMVSNIPRVLRAAERNKAKLALVHLFEANKPKFEGLMARAPHSKKANIAAFNAQVTALKNQLHISTANATSMASAFGDVHLDPTSNTMSVWNNGVIETYRLDPYVAEAYRALHPQELDLMWDLLGIPASVARKGIVSNPVFLLYQSFRDNWQATLNSQYGFRFGVDWFHGWHAAMKNSPEYKQYISRGGGNSLYAQREVLSANKALKAIQVKGITAEGPALGVMVKQLKTMNFLEAYHTLMTPIAEASRVGEYLRARGAGAPALEAVYAAKEITGNYSQVAPLLKGLNRATLFLNPAIKALDQAFYASGLHFVRTPEAGKQTAAARYLIKAFLTLTLPSIAIKLHNDGDEEIAELSKSEYGRRYWFLRLPVGNEGKGTVVKLPKPQFEGQVFATGVEVAIDAWKEKNPSEFWEWKKAVQNDAMVNLLPVMGVVPYSLVSNTDLGTGDSITPEGKERVDPEMQARANTSKVARVVGHALGRVSTNIESDTWRRVMSPAGLDFLAKNLGGTLTTEFLHAVTVAADWNAKGFLAPAEELPIIRGALVNYPTASVRSIEEFYNSASVIERKAKTFEALSESDPAMAVEYFMRNSEWINKAELYGDTRTDIGKIRQSIEDIQNLPGNMITPPYRRELKQRLTQQMIDLARVANFASRQMDQ